MLNKKEHEIVKAALIKHEERELAAIDAMPDPDIEASPELEERIQQIIDGIDEKRKPRTLASAKKIVLIAAIVGVVLMLTACSFIPKIRDFVVTFFEDHFSIVFDSQSGTGYPPLHMPKDIPDGYELVSMTQSAENSAKWTNGEHEIRFTQVIYTSDYVLNVSTNDATLRKLDLNGREVTVSKKQGTSIYIYITDLYVYTAYCSDSVTDEQVLQMFGSIESVPSSAE